MIAAWEQIGAFARVRPRRAPCGPEHTAAAAPSGSSVEAAHQIKQQQKQRGSYRHHERSSARDGEHRGLCPVLKGSTGDACKKIVCHALSKYTIVTGAIVFVLA
ncbi:hypothetical protein NDU88_003895 [Pleurodeles waltl]|uniref:Uncharacterized protein n=1 Tax=Pleurodeles waltl TaxID=8319 RepID=A0AAV7SH83_PLEWA|nr:hypothetical protein NDU88_003895 [Pleurodeles waltl]